MLSGARKYSVVVFDTGESSDIAEASPPGNVPSLSDRFVGKSMEKNRCIHTRKWLSQTHWVKEANMQA